jgi:hypothetical protein
VQIIYNPYKHSECHYSGMVLNQQPIINFSIEIRPATTEQKAAGKRLFSKLIGKAIAVGAAGAAACNTNEFITKDSPPH